MEGNNRIIIQLLVTAVVMIVCMTIYEGVKQVISPEITIWQSHVITIIFSTVIAVTAAFFILKKQSRLNSTLNSRNIESERLRSELENTVSELERKISQVKILSGLLPICSSCKKIRDDRGYWNQIESYIRDNSEAVFSHSICPECAKNLYPDFFNL